MKSLRAIFLWLESNERLVLDEIDAASSKGARLLAAFWRRDRLKMASDEEFNELLAQLRDPVAEATARHLREGMSGKEIAIILKVKKSTALRKIQFVKEAARIVRKKNGLNSSR